MITYIFSSTCTIYIPSVQEVVTHILYSSLLYKMGNYFWDIQKQIRNQYNQYKSYLLVRRDRTIVCLEGEINCREAYNKFLGELSLNMTLLLVLLWLLNRYNLLFTVCPRRPISHSILRYEMGQHFLDRQYLVHHWSLTKQTGMFSKISSPSITKVCSP